MGRAAAPTGQRILPLASGEKPFCFLVPDASLPNTFPENAVHVVLAAGGGSSQVQLHTHEPGRWVEPVAPFTYGGFKSWHADMIGKSWDNGADCPAGELCGRRHRDRTGEPDQRPPGLERQRG